MEKNCIKEYLENGSHKCRKDERLYFSVFGIIKFKLTARKRLCKFCAGQKKLRKR